MRMLAAVTALLVLAGTAFAADPPDPPPSSAAVLQGVVDFAKQHPGNPAGIRDLCLDARAKLPPDSYGFAVVSQRIRDLDKVVHPAYLTIRPSDGPADLPDDAGKSKLALVLKRDLRSRSPSVKMTAIVYLGRLGSHRGVGALARELARTEDSGTRFALVTALTNIGGPAVGSHLGAELPTASVPAQAAALDVLAVLVRASDPAEDQQASRAIGEFIFSPDPVIAERSIDLLAEAGDNGVPGLTRGVEVQDHQLRIMVIEALGDTGSGRAAAVCARFLQSSRGWTGMKDYAVAAMASILRIGRPAVPYLGSSLLDSRRRAPVRRCLYVITGRSFARPDEVAAWWSPHLRKKAKQ